MLSNQQVNLPGALLSVPSFSEQQVHDIVNIVHSVMQQYFAPQNQPPSSPPSTPPSSIPPSSTPPTPQETQKEENEQLLQQAIAENATEKQEQQPPYQIAVKSITESTTKHGSMPDIKSTLSAIPRLCSAHSAACLSNTLLLACLLDYIEHSEGLEATGQG